MKKNLCKSIIITLLLFLNISTAFSNNKFALIPNVKELKENKGFYTVNGKTSVVIKNESERPVAMAFAEKLSKISGLKIEVKKESYKNNYISFNINPKLKNEGYELKIGKSIQLSAKDDRTLALATSTIFQLMNYDNLTIPCLSINDYPEYKWRCVMLDLARRWHPIDYVYQVVDVLQYYKIDKLHLHLSDNESFVVGSELYPKLLKNNPDGSHRYYTLNELKKLVEYANNRGVVIIPEIDMPGHSGMLWKNYPELFGEMKDGKFSPLQAVNMVNDRTYTELAKLLKEISSVFYTSEYIHIGGDEVWMKNITELPQYKSFCKEKNLQAALEGNSQEVYAYFLTRMDSIIRKMGKKTILWEGFANNGAGRIKVPNDINIIVWNTEYNSPKNLIKNGYPIINAAWVPNYMTASMNFTPEQETGFNWKPNAFSHWNHRIKDKKEADSIKVEGGQMCFWEHQYDYVYPVLISRLPSLTENWWNYSGKGTYSDFKESYKILNKKIDSYLCPVSIHAEGLIYDDDISFTDSILVSFKSQKKGTIKYSISDGWENYKMINDLKVWDGKPIKISASSLITVSLYDNKNKRDGYVSQIFYEKMKPMLYYTAYKGAPEKGWDKMPDFNTLPVARKGVFGFMTPSRLKNIQRTIFYGVEAKGHIDTRPYDLANPFALQMNGNIKITKAGKYNFVIKNQDGLVDLYIGDNSFKGTLNNYKEQKYSVYLKKGIYLVRINYYYRHIQNILNITYTIDDSKDKHGIEDIMLGL